MRLVHQLFCTTEARKPIHQPRRMERFQPSPHSYHQPPQYQQLPHPHPTIQPHNPPSQSTFTFHQQQPTPNSLQQYQVSHSTSSFQHSGPPDPNPPTLAQVIADPKDPHHTPQYRIYKRGDSIPGINSPPIIQTTPTKVTVPTQRKSSANTTNPSSSRSASASTPSTPLVQIAQLAKFHKLPTPTYSLTSTTGPPHCPTFQVTLCLGNEKWDGSGGSIKKAQIEAAVRGLEATAYTKPIPTQQHLGSSSSSTNGASGFGRRGQRPTGWPKLRNGQQQNQRASSGSVTVEPTIASTPTPAPVPKNPISSLYEIINMRKLGVSFEVIEESGPAHNKTFTLRCTCEELELELGRERATTTTTGSGPTKQEAKKSACSAMIQKLGQELVEGGGAEVRAPNARIRRGAGAGANASVHKNKKSQKSYPVLKSSSGEPEPEPMNPISQLIQLAQRERWAEPTWKVEQSEVPIPIQPHQQFRRNNSNRPPGPGPSRPNNHPRTRPHFTIEVTAGPYTGIGSGPNKKTAKKLAAQKVLDEVCPRATVTESPAPAPVTESPLRILSARQIVPGLLVINEKMNPTPPSQNPIVVDPPTTGTGLESKIQNLSLLRTDMTVEQSTPTPATGSNVNKLVYLCSILGLRISWNDFPMKSEYLSVLSLYVGSGNTNTTLQAPSRVCHGIGPTTLEAREQAAQLIIGELERNGLDSLSTNNTPAGRSDGITSGGTNGSGL